MNVDAKKCPDCRTRLEIVSLSDLRASTGQRSKKAKPSPADDVLAHFIFNVCPNCGRTIVYAGSEVRKLAADSRDAVTGLS